MRQNRHETKLDMRHETKLDMKTHTEQNYARDKIHLRHNYTWGKIHTEHNYTWDEIHIGQITHAIHHTRQSQDYTQGKIYAGQN